MPEIALIAHLPDPGGSEDITEGSFVEVEE